jgi:5'-3' exonuclease
MTRLMYLDASSLAYRAFFSVPKTIKDDSGQPVNAVRGFMDMAARLKSDHEPDQLVAVFDNDWRPAFRVSAYSGYKAERPDEPEELTPQFGMLAEVLDLAGIARAGADGFEADDVIATYSVGVEGEDRGLVVTGDRDLLCLVRDPHVELLFPVKGVTELKRFDEAAVREAYGVPASLYSEFATLRGDSSDGLPGIKGVGPKTACKLLADHGSIAGIYEHLDELTPRVRSSFEGARDYIEAMKLVVPPRTDCEIEATEGKQPSVTELKAYAAAHNLDGPVTRLLAALGTG